MNYIVIISVLISHFFLIKRKSFTIFLLIIIFAPPLKFFGIFNISSHYLFLPYIGYTILLQKTLKISRLSFFHLLIIIVAIAASLAHLEYFNYLILVGFVSYLFILIFLTSNEAFNLNECLRSFMIWALFLNVIAVLFQFFYPLEAYDFINTYYFTDTTRTAIDNHIEWFGRFIRFPGLFFSPLLLSGFSLYSSLYFIKNKKWFLLIFSITLGFFTISKSFFMGLIVLLIYFFHQIFGIRKAFFFTIPVFTFFVFLFFSSIIEYLNQNDYASIQDIFVRAFESRYNSTDTDLLNYYTILNIPKSPLIGHGFSMLPSVFIGDSVFIDTFYQVGVIGFIIFIFILNEISESVYHLLILLILAAGINYLFSIAFLPLILMKYDRLNFKKN